MRFNYDPSRSSDIPIKLLKDWEGCLMTDGYPGYNKVGKQGGNELLACWVHVRRYFMGDIKLHPPKIKRDVRMKSSP